MKIQILHVSALLVLPFFLAAGTPNLSELKSSQHIAFTENKGQVHNQENSPRTDILFGASKGDLNFHFLKHGINYQFSKVEMSDKNVLSSKLNKQSLKKVSSITTQRIELNWLKASNTVRVEGEDQLPGLSNYYTQSSPTERVNSFSSLWYRGLYKGTDLHYYEKNGKLKYDLIVGPIGDYKTIQLQVKGTTDIKLQADGTLLLRTELGDVQEGAPIVFEDGKQLNAKWKIEGSVLSFDITGHKVGHTLLIDPTTRLWGTYYGGSNSEAFFNCAADASLNVYAVGICEAGTGTIIATTGAYQTSFGGGAYDALIVKFNAAGVRQWSTYYGGAGDDIAQGCAVNSAGDLFVSGSADGGSGTVLSTPGAFQVNPIGGSDAFLSKFTSSGTRVWGTYFGESGDEETVCCATDGSGNAYICGYTDAASSTLIATPGAFQTTFGGSTDAYLVKFNSAGARVWSTYYGDTGDDWFSYCATDAAGNVYASGASDSQNNISSANCFQANLGGSVDAIAVKFNAAGARQWGTYYGGASDDVSYMSTIDANGNFVFGGDSNTPTALGTTGAHQTSMGGQVDAFVASFSTTGTRNWGTYYGGNSYDDFYSISNDGAGNIFFTGTTDAITGTAIAGPGSWQATNGGGASDAYLVKINPNGQRVWSTFYGGNDDEVGYCAGLTNGNVYMAGNTGTGTGTAIASSGSHQSNFGGASDGFIALFNSCIAPNAPTNISAPISMNACSNKYNVLTSSGAGTTVWYNAATGGSLLATGFTFSIGNTAPGIYTVYLEAQECTNSASRTAVVYTVNAAPSLTLNLNRTTICAGDNQNVSVSGATTYSWNTGSTSASISVSPTTTAQYTATGFTGVCNAKVSFTLSVSNCTGIDEASRVANFKLYPNPNKGAFDMTTSEAATLTIYDLVGNKIQEKQVVEGSHHFELTVPAGVYVMQINTASKTEYLKFVRE